MAEIVNADLICGRSERGREDKAGGEIPPGRDKSPPRPPFSKGGVIAGSATGDPVWLPLLGKAFEYGGRGPEAFDCWGLCVEIYRRLGRELPEYASHHDCAEIHRRIATARLSLDDRAEWVWRELSSPEPWCLVTFKIRPPFTSHVGVVLPGGARRLLKTTQGGAVIPLSRPEFWRPGKSGAPASWVREPVDGSAVERTTPAPTRFIHIMERCRVAVERLDDRAWSRRVSGFFVPNLVEVNHG